MQNKKTDTVSGVTSETGNRISYEKSLESLKALNKFSQRSLEGMYTEKV